MSLKPDHQTETTTDRNTQPGLSPAEQVRLALKPGLMGEYLQQLPGLEPEGNQNNRRLPCRILYMKIEPGDYCIVLYELGPRLVVGHLQWKNKLHHEVGYWLPEVGMRVYPYPLDPWLPSMTQALDPQVIAKALTQSIPELSSEAKRILRVEITPQRYRPGKRLTLRLDLNLKDNQTGEFETLTLYAKVYHNLAKARAVFEEMKVLADSPAVKSGRIILAETAGYIDELSIVLQKPVAGIPLENMIGSMDGPIAVGDPRAFDGTLLAASALAALHTSGVTTHRQRPIADELVRFHKRAARIASINPELGAQLSEVASILHEGLERLDSWGAEISLTHGDCKPSQFLISDAGVALLDFDHCGMADPANDVGTFLATLRQLAIRQSLKSHGRDPASARSAWLLTLENHFLDDYCTASQRDDGFRKRAAWYEAVALVRKALRGFGRSPFSPLPGALAAEAWNCLPDLNPSGIDTSTGARRQV
ncbi:MAG: hypothetical protein EHM70_19805 [Chloroflexota bacterium]|nr:MAG: hypothetical protein EHM70_19805 [Chloroflexota bacterium]